MLNLKDVVTFYGKTMVLREVNLSVREGEIVALLGERRITQWLPDLNAGIAEEETTETVSIGDSVSRANEGRVQSV